MAPKIIIDTDPGVDDVLAILLALASPEVDVSLISIVFGNTHAPVAHDNLLKIYHMLAKEIAAIPDTVDRYGGFVKGQEDKTVLALGEDGPIGGEKAVAAYFHGPDGLSNISVTHPQFTPAALAPDAVHDHLVISPRPAYEEILKVLAEEPEHRVTIVAVGPLTNVAHALRSDPTTFAKIHTLVWMGGAIDHPGNTSPSAEFNCFADPYAAAETIAAARTGAFDLVMAPLDITTPHQIPFDDLIHHSYPSNPDPSVSPLRSFISAMLVRVRGLQASFGLPDAMEMHDPVAVWYALAHAGLPKGQLAPGWQSRGRDFKIERTGELTRGMCVVDRRGGGEEEGENRTQSDKLKNNSVPSLDSDTRVKDRDGSDVADKGHEHALPMVLVKTPGSEALRKLLLARVFGPSA